MIIEKVNSPGDLKQMSMNELNDLACEMRDLIIKKVNTTGGHLGPNLGIIETTIAMHYVFESPKDKIIYDVSHQCYPHKILTGRKECFTDCDKYYKYSGYTAPEESCHDIYKVGHTSTSVSLALGTAKARDLKNEKGNVIALIGDGSLSGGEAYEGFNNAACFNGNLIIVVNDNDMSIAQNQGGLYKNLKLLRETAGKSQLNFFKTLGFDYIYVDEGNNIEEMINVFKKVKDINHPIVVHVKTQKGHGLKCAIENKEMFHWIMPSTLDDENNLNVTNSNIQNIQTYNSITTDFILNKAKDDKTVVAITPATPGAYGFNYEFRQTLGEQYIDVGIAEEHAVAYASSLAKSGAKPFLAVLSSFIQRTYDQLSQDLCLNNSPVSLLIYWGAITNADATHLGVFDIPLISNIPNMVYLAPSTKEEYIAMLEYAYKQKNHPLAIRVPFGEIISSGKPDNTDYSILNKFKVTHEGENLAIIGLGNFYHLGEKVAKILKEKHNINATIINPRFITGVDVELLENLKVNHNLVITLEDGVIDGGFGEKITRFYGNSNMKVLNFGAKKEFTDRVPLDELYSRYHLTCDDIIKDVLKFISVCV